MIDVRRLIRDAESLEPLPASTSRLAALLCDDERDVAEVVAVVRLDEALTGRLLAAANSASGGSRVEIVTVDEAVVRVGPGTLLALALAGSVRGEMSTAIPAYGLQEGALWRHSVASALAVEHAGSHCRREVPPEAYAAALLHDVGKLVLARHLGPGTVELLRRDAKDGDQDELPLDHAELGALVARHWRLPKRVAQAIRYHHRPLSAPSAEARTLAWVVALADAVARHIGADGGGGPLPNEYGPVLAERLGLAQREFDALTEETGRHFDEVLAAYG